MQQTLKLSEEQEKRIEGIINKYDIPFNLDGFHILSIIQCMKDFTFEEISYAIDSLKHSLKLEEQSEKTEYQKGRADGLSYSIKVLTQILK